MSLEYKPASELLHISVKLIVLKLISDSQSPKLSGVGYQSFERAVSQKIDLH